jgi:hypothetical protein
MPEFDGLLRLVNNLSDELDDLTQRLIQLDRIIEAFAGDTDTAHLDEPTRQALVRLRQLTAAYRSVQGGAEMNDT